MQHSDIDEEKFDRRPGTESTPSPARSLPPSLVLGSPRLPHMNLCSIDVRSRHAKQGISPSPPADYLSTSNLIQSVRSPTSRLALTMPPSKIPVDKRPDDKIKPVNYWKSGTEKSSPAQRQDSLHSISDKGTSEKESSLDNPLKTSSEPAPKSSKLRHHAPVAAPSRYDSRGSLRSGAVFRRSG